MNIFKKTPFISKDKNLSLVELIDSYNTYQKEINKIETEHSTYWLAAASIFIVCSIVPLFFMPYVIGISYIAVLALRFKYNRWVKIIRKSHNESLDHFIFFLQENEKEIMKDLYDNVKNNELEEIFHKIITKCAKNEYDENILFQIDNFLYKSEEEKRKILQEEKVNELKKMYKIPFKHKEDYEVPLSLKEKYNEMC